MSDSLVDLLRRAIAIREEGRAVVGCLLVKARGSTPQSAGTLMLVDDAARSFGTVGGGCVEAEVRQRAFRMLADGERGILRFELDHDYGWDDGMICGGTLELAVAPLPAAEVLARIVADVEARRETTLDLEVEAGPEREAYRLSIPPRERLYVAGAGHIGQAVARLALPLEFDVTLFDDRADMLDRFAPAGAGKTPGAIADALARAPIDGGTYCVVVTRGHRHDERALEAVVGRGAQYVGMIGSRRKVKLVFDGLAERGVPAEELARVHAPIGLDVGAVTIEEIAISIAAQLVEVRRRSARPVVEKIATARAPLA